jgi:hypothetical protein
MAAHPAQIPPSISSTLTTVDELHARQLWSTHRAHWMNILEVCLFAIFRMPCSSSKRLLRIVFFAIPIHISLERWVVSTFERRLRRFASHELTNDMKWKVMWRLGVVLSMAISFRVYRTGYGRFRLAFAWLPVLSFFALLCAAKWNCF